MKPTEPTTMPVRHLRDRILAVTLSLVTAASMVPTRALAEVAAEASPAAMGSAQVATSAETSVATAASASIYSTYLTTSASSTSGTYAFDASDMLWAWAREKGSSTPIDPTTLTYQWQVSSDNSTWKDIPGATAQSLSLANCAGRYVRCTLATADGSSSRTTRSRNKVAAAGSVNLVNVSLSNAGKLAPGNTITATAKDASGADATSNASVTWSWYASDSAYGTGEKIAGATTPTLTVTSDLLGKYVYASADGGYGATKSSAAGPVQETGAVTLYKVTVDASDSAKVGQTLTATAYTSSYTQASSTDVVHYQWQWAASKTTDDSAFTDISGATSATFTVPEQTSDGTSLLGTYLRVKATSGNSVVSTSVPSYYGTTATDPVGPVALAGAYDVSSVKLSSSATNAQVGATLTAQPQYEKTSGWGTYETDLPSDAKLTCTWYAADDAAGTNARELTPEDGATGATLKLSSSLEGAYVWASCSALMASAESEKTQVKAAGAYDLHHIVRSPSSSALVTGDTVKAAVYASQLSGSNVDVTGNDGVSLQWYVADTPSGEWQPLDGCTSASLQVPESAAGKYLKVVATSGTSTVESTFDQAVVEANTLAGAVVRLQNENWRPSLTYGTDINVNDVLLAKLADEGVDTTGLTVRVSNVSFSDTDANATVGISTADADNGAITYFSCDTDKVSSWNISSLQTVSSITFTLTRGDETVTYTPNRTFQVPWDENAARAVLQKKADAITLGFAQGDSADSVTQAFTLPASLGGASATWTASDSSVKVTGESWDSTLTATPTRGSANTPVTLTATISFTGYGMPEVSVTKDFPIIVKADPEAVAAAQAELASKVESSFTYDKVTAFSTGDVIDPTAVTGDLQLPTTRTLGVDGKYYAVAYSSNDSLVSFNGYHATVVRPLGTARTATITCTVTDKSNPEITASKSLEFTLSPVSEQEIDAAVSLMEKAKAGYALALLDGQDASNVTGDLRSFQGAYEDASGNLAWARDRDTQSAHPGIVPVDLPGYSDMGGMTWRTFKSSRPDVISNELLAYTQPTDNTRVTITSRLADERFQAYYEFYKDDPTVSDQLKAKLASLVDQDVSATFTVTGTSGKDAPEQVTASCSVIGPNAAGANVSWAPENSLSVEPGTTAADLTKKILDANGITYDDGLYTFTKDGNSLGYDAATGKCWQLFINGESATVMASNYVLKEGDQVVWYYSAWGDSLPGQVTGSVKVIGKDASGLDQVWADTTSLTLVEGSTAADLSEAAFSACGLTRASSTSSWGYYLSTITSPVDGRVLGWDASTGAYWHLFVNGKASQVGASSVNIANGDEVVWYYCTDSDSLPKSDALVVDPSATRPTSLSAAWPGYKGTDETGVVRGLATPVPGSSTYARLDWAQSRTTTSMFVNASDAIVVNGNVYDAAQTQLYRRDASTGVVLDEARLAASVDSTARLQYADGLILVPLHGGRIQALTADTLTTVWVSAALPTSTSSSGKSVDQQLLSSITVRDGKAYFSTVAPDGSDSCGGYVACVSLADGSLVWSHEGTDAGYYWTGAVPTSAGVLTANDEGRVSLFGTATGEELSSVELGTRCRAQLAVSGNVAYAVTTDGVLHELYLRTDGSLTAGRSVRFGSYSTSSPTICDGRIYVGGSSSADVTRGALFVIDLASMSVKHEALVPTTSVEGQVGTGDVKSAPLVSVALDGNTYVYFTSNGKPGGVYAYRLGDAEATTLYQPASDLWQYCMSSIACDASGNLYYFNDSGTLFKLDAGATTAAPGEKGQGGENNAGSAGGRGNAGTSGNAGGNTAGSAFGNATSTSTAAKPSKPHVTVSGGNASTGSATAGALASENSSLLGSYSSEDVTAVTSTGAKEPAENGETSASETSANQSGLPIWPIIGTCMGAALLILLLATRRRRGDDGTAEGRRG
ncbi:DUF4430 domain-containing protein [Tractidigestivibacter scatoligenes]|jgi:hypothetical protein|uniref:DUF4430 domain-containing protein n=1 Tax=Tractidigestivibacter scatoligenes TaxID=1299998 RepID=UPI002F356334